MRGAQDRDFGVQIVGRILRVDRRLQGRQVSDLLKYGYVFLADAEKQTGLTGAADKINAIRTEMSAISPFTMLVTIAGTDERPGSAERTSTLYAGKALGTARNPGVEDSGSLPRSSTNDQQDLLYGFILPPAKSRKGSLEPCARRSSPLTPPGQRQYLLRDGIPRVFKTERLNLNTSGLLHCVEKRIRFDDKVLTSGLRQAVNIRRKEEEIFTHDVTYGEFQARLSDADIAIRGQRLLFEPDYLDPRELQKALLNRLTAECKDKGFDDLLESPENLRRAMHLILISHKNLLRDAVRTCCAQHAELVDTVAAARKPSPGRQAALPPGLASTMSFPPDLNSDELAFAQLLDGDMSETVEWWHRNEPSKLHSVGLVMPDGKGYFPDFMVKVKGRSKGDGILMIEVKGEFLMNSSNTPDKAQASHGLYRHPLMVMLENSGRWMTLRFNEKTDKLEPDAVFRLDALAEY